MEITIRISAKEAAEFVLAIQKQHASEFVPEDSRGSMKMCEVVS
jgi:hypothetical protein